MKVILNQDVPNLGELGDVKVVANGYARNYLLPRGLAYAYSPKVVAMFEKRKAEIEAHKASKRVNSAELKGKIEAEELIVELPAGPTGKLFGAVTNTIIAEELLKKNIHIDRKRIDIPDRVIKAVGNYRVLIQLYENEEAQLKVSVKGIVEKKQEAPKAETARKKRHEAVKSDSAEEARTENTEETVVKEEQPEE